MYVQLFVQSCVSIINTTWLTTIITSQLIQFDKADYNNPRQTIHYTIHIRLEHLCISFSFRIVYNVRNFF